jgi:hypothetical protein
MSPVNVYSSAPETTKLACAFQNVRRAGLGIVVRPIAQMPATSTGRKELLRLRDQLHEVYQLLANTGQLLDLCEKGEVLLAIGEEQGLRADRDSLDARLRGLQVAIAKLEGRELAKG